jgi:hypothetical protein
MTWQTTGILVQYRLLSGRASTAPTHSANP